MRDLWSGERENRERERERGEREREKQRKTKGEKDIIGGKKGEREEMDKRKIVRVLRT